MPNKHLQEEKNYHVDALSTSILLYIGPITPIINFFKQAHLQKFNLGPRNLSYYQQPILER